MTLEASAWLFGLWITGIVLLLTALWILRRNIRLTRWCASNKDLSGQVAVVTGGTSGIGQVVATELARRKCTLYIPARDTRRSQSVVDAMKEQSNNDDIHLLYMDNAHLASIRDFSETFLKKVSRLDILINNAAYEGPLDYTADGLERSFGVNHISHFLLTNLLLNILIGSRGRVVNVTSDSFRNERLDFGDINYKHNPTCYTIYGAYGRSKLANVMFTKFLPKYCGVPAFAVHPGATCTRLLRHWPGLPGFLIRMIGRLLFKSPLQGAQSVLHCALEDDLVIGGLYTNCEHWNTAPICEAECDLLWQISQNLCSKFMPSKTRGS